VGDWNNNGSCLPAEWYVQREYENIFSALEVVSILTCHMIFNIVALAV
jgi:hypothetical protein